MNFQKSKVSKISAFLTALLVGSGASSIAAAEAGSNFVTNPVGEHARILLVKKSVNPQNFMAVYTKVKDDCTFEPDTDKSGHVVFDFYWLMDGSRYKPVASAIKNEIHGRLQARASDSPNTFTVAVNDLKQVNTDIPSKNWKLDVVSSKSSKGCSVKAYMKLGPSNDNAKIVLKELYTDASANIFTRSVKIRSITLTGTHVTTGARVRQTYQGR